MFIYRPPTKFARKVARHFSGRNTDKREHELQVSLGRSLRAMQPTSATQQELHLAL